MLSQCILNGRLLYSLPLGGFCSTCRLSPGKRHNLGLKSQRPFATSGKDHPTQWDKGPLDSYRMWSVEWQPSTSRLHEYITSPSRSSPGSDLPRQAWVKLNWLRIGVGRFNAESRLQLQSRPADSKSQSAPYTIHQMVSMAWLMLMQIQQVVSGY